MARTVRTAEAGGDDLDLAFALAWGEEGTLLDAHVFGPVQNDGGLGRECGGHREGGYRFG
jgi:hypothetical protein